MIPRLKYLLILLIALLATNIVHARFEGYPVSPELDTFPVPQLYKGMLFYVQRTPNTNTIMYEVNVKDGKLDADNPVHVYWIRYADNGEKKELNYIQRKFAYGLNVKKLGENNYDLRFVSYNKHPLYLRKATDNNYYIYTDIAGKQAALRRIYIRIDPGGTFWSPNVKYIELKGTEVTTGKEISERFKP